VETPELNLSIFEGRPEAGAVAAALETLPFMSPRRAVVIRNTDILGSGCPAEASKPLEKAVIPKTNVLVIYADSAIDKRKSLYKHIVKYGMTIDCEALQEGDIVSYIEKTAQKAGLIISRRNAQFLNEALESDMEAIGQELGKLVAVCTGEIRKQDIEMYVNKSAQYNAYKIHDFMVSGQYARAKELIDQIVRDDPNPVGMITMISNNFRQMLVARACKDAGYDNQRTIKHVVDATGAKEWTARRALESCKKYSAAKIRAGIKKLADMDYDAKQGGVVLKTDLFALLMDLYVKNSA
jgi:DNA polymerase-3 subunit delta